MKMRQIWKGILLASIFVMAGAPAFCVQPTNNLGNQDTEVQSSLTAGNPTATAAQQDDIAVNTSNNGSSAAVSVTGGTSTGGSGNNTVTTILTRLDDRVSTMMAVYRQREERLARKSLSQPQGPAGSGLIRRYNKNKVWGRYLGVAGDQDSINSMDGYQLISHGALFGYDRFLTDRFLLGFGAGYMRTDIETDVGGQTSVNAYNAGLYGSYIFSDVDFLNFAFFYTRGEIESDSTIANYGTLSGETDSNTYMLAAEYGRKFLVMNRFVLTPVAGFVASLVDVPGYTATGTGQYGAEEYADAKSKFFTTRIGIKGDWAFAPSALLKVRALWTHEHSNDLESVTEVRYENTTSFVKVKGLDPGRDKGIFGLGLRFAFQNGLSFDIDSDLTVGEKYKSWSGSGKLEYAF
ncbi:exported hypothetical protein [Candidatus Desulfarcum epimagneticum]|uniref:Autotransporter domain-containing protein n=1 Tax=uncultured Desulfobacteraceae bacterium TaxID=218296 RepID=A0A484HGB1_9BACT|nr:exported hypothetical protein [uncultured Desulfobacteraceae bacterium]